MTVQPLGNRALIKPITPSETTTSGIIIPDNSSTSRTSKGEIIWLGGGAELERLGLAKGNTVLFENIACEEIEGLKIVDYNKILAVIN